MSTEAPPAKAYLPSPFRSDLFDGRVVLVTGGGTGIGLAIAREAAASGAKIAICGRREEPLLEASRILRADGAEVFAAPCDIRNAEGVSAFVASVLAHYGRIDVLVNNAGGQFPSPAAVMSPKGFEAVIRNNLVGTFNMTHAVANQAMIPARSGNIVNIIANIYRGFPGMAHTGAARAGVENLTRSLAVEWAPHRVRVNAVAPGTIVSSGTERYPPELITRARAKTPAGRLGEPEEVAHAVLYLASDAAAYVTGTTLYIDGGAALWGDIFELEHPDGLPR